MWFKFTKLSDFNPVLYLSPPSLRSQPKRVEERYVQYRQWLNKETLDDRSIYMNIREAWLTLSVCLSLINAFFPLISLQTAMFRRFSLFIITHHYIVFFSLCFFHFLFLFVLLVLAFVSLQFHFHFASDFNVSLRCEARKISPSFRFVSLEAKWTAHPTPYQMAASTSGQVTPDPSFSHCTLPLTFIPAEDGEVRALINI
jgi:hypothetical protein